ncbi:MAG: inorganic phosphate transporter, partial [Gammaproteobacteria bacterium]|nr:inorganic phosphate transporter [Gammaproteobacteria bacterium]
MDQISIYIILAAVFGLLMAWGIGANDVANAMATSVGSKAITVYQAIFIAAIFEFAGAYLAGGSVTSTIRKGIVDSLYFADNPDLLVFGMLASLLSAGIWLFIASRNGWPVSTTHTIVGAIVGFAAVGVGMDAVKWGKVGTIVMSWIVSPLLAGTIALMIFRSIQRLILDTDKPLDNARKYGPVYIFAVVFVIAMLTMKKGLKHLSLDISTGESFVYAIAVAFVFAIIGVFLVRRVKVDPDADLNFHYANVEKVFAVLMVFTASAMAFAHGSNDVANAIGPVAAVVSTVTTGGVLQKSV